MNAYLSAPLSDTVGVSVAGFHNDEGPSLVNINTGRKFGRVKEDSVRLKLQLRLGEAFKMTVTGDYTRSDSPGVLANYFVGGESSLSGAGVPIASNDEEMSAGALPVYSTRNRGLTGIAEWDLGDFTLKSISAHRRTRLDAFSDGDATILPLLSFQARLGWNVTTQELNLSGNLTDRLSLIAGLYYFRSKSTVALRVNGGDYDAPAVILQSFAGQNTTSYAAFGGLTFDVSDRISLDAQARYTHDRRRYYFNDLRNSARNNEDSRSWGNPTYRFVARYKFANDSQAYVNYSTGFKSGLFNTSSAVSNAVDPEKMRAWEIGYKANLPGGAFLTLAAFDYDYKDLQFQVLDLRSGFGLLLQNAAAAHIQGAEVSLRAPLGRSFAIDTGLSWAPISKYTNFLEANVNIKLPNGGTSAGVRDLSGTRMVQAPKLTATVALSVETEIAGGSFQGAVQAAYNSGYWTQLGPRLGQGAFTLLNGYASWKPDGTPVRLSVWIQNALDERYSISTTSNAFGDFARTARGREIGVGLAFDF